MDEETLDPFLKQAIISRLEGWELVEFLDISTDDVVSAFEDKIIENIEEVTEFINYFVKELDEDGEDN